MAPAAEVPALAVAGAPSSAGAGGVAGARRYYADSGDGPGQWRGLGAAALGLAGEVDDEAFARVLAGKHPHTGETAPRAPPHPRSTAKVADVLDGDPAEELPLAEAARLTGLSAQYLRRVCRTWEQRHDEIEATIAAGQRPTLAYLVSTRTDQSSYRVTREELAAFLIRRRPPTVRVGFDLTLTTEKSLGILALLGPPDVRAEVLAAIAAGNDAGLDYLEQHAAWARAEAVAVGVRAGPSPRSGTSPPGASTRSPTTTTSWPTSSSTNTATGAPSTAGACTTTPATPPCWPPPRCATG